MDIYQELLHRVDHGQSVALLLVVGTVGSTPHSANTSARTSLDIAGRIENASLTVRGDPAGGGSKISMGVASRRPRTLNGYSRRRR